MTVEWKQTEIRPGVFVRLPYSPEVGLISRDYVVSFTADDLAPGQCTHSAEFPFPGVIWGVSATQPDAYRIQMSYHGSDHFQTRPVRASMVAGSSHQRPRVIANGGWFMDRNAVVTVTVSGVNQEFSPDFPIDVVFFTIEWRMPDSAPLPRL